MRASNGDSGSGGRGAASNINGGCGRVRVPGQERGDDANEGGEPQTRAGELETRGQQARKCPPPSATTLKSGPHPDQNPISPAGK
jgi:hypothetical protein